MLRNQVRPDILRDLGDGLVLRQATPADANALAEFNSRIHSDNGPEQPDMRVAAWTRDLLERPHPTFQPGDFTIVEEAASGRIVSSMNLISQTWTYAGIPFGVGRPELVGTAPEYRNRGLVRAQFEVVHHWSAERGELLQAITGIPYYYRLFGYEMAVNLGGGRAGYRPQLPRLKEGETEPYRVRNAEEADLDFIIGLSERAGQRSLLDCIRNRAMWRYELLGRSENNVQRPEFRIVEGVEAGDRVGYLAHTPMNWGSMIAASAYELISGVSYAAVTPTVIRYLWKIGKKRAEEEGKADEFDSFGFWLGAEHPAYTVMKDTLPRVRQPYTWYLRVPDLPAFLRRVIPVLEARLEASALSDHTGDLKLTFYRDGVQLSFAQGRITAVNPYRPTPVGHEGDAAFPGLTFLQLLFGYRSLEELKYAFPDCWYTNDTIYGLLNALFPKLFSQVWPVA